MRYIKFWTINAVYASLRRILEENLFTVLYVVYFYVWILFLCSFAFYGTYKDINWILS